jgi:ubiquinone/menaquinone biosynthesis C-methylase UbiE
MTSRKWMKKKNWFKNFCGGSSSDQMEEEELHHEMVAEWDYFASFYNQYFVPAFGEIYRAIVAEIDDDSRYVLDFGTGPGEPAITLYRQKGGKVSVDGIDWSPKMIEVARSRSKELDLPEPTQRLKFWHVENLEKFNPRYFFDVVISSFALTYVSDLKETLGELHRMMAPEKKLIMTTFPRPFFLF